MAPPDLHAMWPVGFALWIVVMAAAIVGMLSALGRTTGARNAGGHGLNFSDERQAALNQ